MAKCQIPCSGGDLLQQCQTWLSYHNVIVAITFLPVSWRMWPLPVLCSSGVPCRKVHGSQARGWLHTKAGRTPTAQQPQLCPSPTEMSAPCSKPVLDTGDSTGSAPWCSSVKSYLWLSLHQAPLWGALSNFYINKKPASYIAHTPTYLPGYMEKVNSERFYVPLVWLDTLCFNTSTGSQGRNKVFSFQSAWTWHLLPEGFVLFVLSQLHFNSVQQCWKTWQNIPECLISMNGQTSKS